MSFFNHKHNGKFNTAPKADRTWGSVVFDSRLEMLIAQTILVAFKPEQIHIWRQFKFELIPTQREGGLPKGRLIFKERRMSPDFLIRNPENTRPDAYLVIDAKGMMLPDFVLRTAIFYWRYKHEIYCVKSPKDLLKVPWGTIGLQTDNEIFLNGRKRNERIRECNVTEQLSRFISPAV